MKREAAEILKDALALPTEADRRVAEFDTGAVKTIPQAEVRRRLAAP